MERVRDNQPEARQMQFVDLKSQYTHIQEDIQARIQVVLEHGRYVMGPEIDELEARLAEMA